MKPATDEHFYPIPIQILRYRVLCNHKKNLAQYSLEYPWKSSNSVNLQHKLPGHSSGKRASEVEEPRTEQSKRAAFESWLPWSPSM